MESRDWLDVLNYHGIDISPAMIELARKEWPSHSFELRDIIRDGLPESSYDFTVLNGVFTSKFDVPWEEMEKFVERMLVSAWSSTRHALAFNVMTIHVDWERPDLFHWPVDSALAFCKTALSRHVIVRANYELYEYTVEVHRAPRAPSGPVPAHWLRTPTGDLPPD